MHISCILLLCMGSWDTKVDWLGEGQSVAEIQIDQDLASPTWALSSSVWRVRRPPSPSHLCTFAQAGLLEADPLLCLMRLCPPTWPRSPLRNTTHSHSRMNTYHSLFCVLFQCFLYWLYTQLVLCPLITLLNYKSVESLATIHYWSPTNAQ